MRFALINEIVAVGGAEDTIHAPEVLLTSTERNHLRLVVANTKGVLTVRILTLFNPEEADATLVAKLSNKLAQVVDLVVAVEALGHESKDAKAAIGADGTDGAWKTALLNILAWDG